MSTFCLEVAAQAAIWQRRTTALVCSHLPVAVQVGRLRRHPGRAKRLPDAPLYLATGLAGWDEDPAAAVRLPTAGRDPDLLVVDTIGEQFRPAVAADDAVGAARRDRRRRRRGVLGGLVDHCRSSGVGLILGVRGTPRRRLVAVSDVVLQLGPGPTGPTLVVTRNRFGPVGPAVGVLAQFSLGRFVTVVDGADRRHD